MQNNQIQMAFQKKLYSKGESFEINLSLSLVKGSISAIYGKSGAGKSTFLRLIAGLIRADQGYLKVGNHCWYDSKKEIFLAPQKRKIGFVFQDYALFPNMTVRKNLLFALSNPEYLEDLELLEHLLKVTDLKPLEHRYPASLSGGEQQRVALARAFLRKPEILLLDEPLCALDRETRLLLQKEILKLHQEFGTTTLLVSHDLPEVFKLAPYVYLMEKGKIIQEGTPENLFLRSKISGKFRFTGEILVLEKEELVFLVTVLVENSPVKIVVTKEEGKNLNVGEQVFIYSKAFNPILLKLER